MAFQVGTRGRRFNPPPGPFLFKHFPFVHSLDEVICIPLRSDRQPRHAFCGTATVTTSRPRALDS